jgi:hypothetical protein
MGRRDRAVRGCAALLAVLVGATASSAAAAAPTVRAGVRADGQTGQAPPEVTPGERAAELAEPAIVEVDVRWQGYVYDHSGTQVDLAPVTASTRCTGVGVGGSGYLLTTAGCLDQAAVATEAFRQIVDRRIANGSLSADQAETALENLLVTANIGTDKDNPSERTVSVRRAVTDDGPMVATVVSIAQPADGDVALLKINRSNQPVLAVAGDNAVAVGDEVVTMQLPTDGAVLGGTAAATGTASPTGTVGAPVRPTSRTGTVADIGPRVMVTPSQPQDPATVLPGGVVVTPDATIVGLVDTSLPDGDLLVPSAAIRDLLTDAEVENALGPVDRDFRAGLDAYYAGRYTESIESFDSVLAIIPSHVQAHDFRGRAQTLRAAEGGGPAPADSLGDKIRSWIRPKSGLIVGVGVLLAIAVFLIRRRHPHSTAEPDRADVELDTEPAEAAPSADETHSTTAGPVG